MKSAFLACALALPVAAVAAPLPTVDLAADTARQVVIAQGTAAVYQGHPTTLLLLDGKTMFCVWTLGHGGTCGPMKRSGDGGKTWSDLLPVPENWTTVRNCPALYRLSDAQGVARLFVFAGQGPDGKMHQAHSTDDGKTWTPWRIILDMGALKPCEPAIVRSPDGKQLLCLLRENSRTAGSLYMTSEDKGVTWSEAKPLPIGLTGDRHMPRYAMDGRLVVCFRDTGKSSATKNHFVAWVGRYEDIVNGQDGQHRIKLLHSHAGGDCGYPGLELLPDGTFVATTYIKYRPGPGKQSVVSTRFKLAETDARE